jgi:hypothetical protein
MTHSESINESLITDQIVKKNELIMIPQSQSLALKKVIFYIECGRSVTTPGACLHVQNRLGPRGCSHLSSSEIRNWTNDST